jgi:hypothetical protein
MSTPRTKKNGGSGDIDPSPALGKTIQRLRKAYNMSLVSFPNSPGSLNRSFHRLREMKQIQHFQQFTAYPERWTPALMRFLRPTAARSFLSTR